MGVSVPEELDLTYWRVIGAENMSVTLHEMRTHWDLEDLQDATEYLDLVQEMQRKSIADAERAQKKSR